MNLADPELELIDPTPDVHSLFVHFDQLFFDTRLVNKCIVRWSKRMYSSAGITSYRKGTFCEIALSEPLLKLRPRQDLVQTLLHEMIHAYLFVDIRNGEREEHGPKFKAHMHRINNAAGLNITIYHDFHDEVRLYLKHCWRCNGRCQNTPPYFGLVRRAVNRAPGPTDPWWKAHQILCGGTYLKISDGKTNANIPKKNINSVAVNKNVNKENKITNHIHVITKPALSKSPVFGKPVDFGRERTNSVSVIETVRNVWATKQIPIVPGEITHICNRKKHRSNSVVANEPPKKIMKIDDYFKATASSILKDVYGKEFMITQSNNSPKLKAVVVSDSIKVPPVNVYVECPTCNAKVYSNDINRHLDECLNRDIIEKLSQDSKPIKSEVALVKGTPQSFENIQHIPNIKPKPEINIENDNVSNLKSINGNIQTIPLFKEDIKNKNTDNIIKTEADYKNKATTSTLFYVDEIPSTSKGYLAQTCLSCGMKVDIPMNLHLNKCHGFFNNNSTIPKEFNTINIKTEPGTNTLQTNIKKCPCCGIVIDKPIEEHFEECLSFFSNNTTIPVEGSSAVETIIIDDDDDDNNIIDESQTYNKTGTKSPCPCCFKMIEINDMNIHLDVCLSISLS